MSAKTEQLRSIVTKIGSRSGPGGTVYSVQLCHQKQARWTDAFVTLLIVVLVWIFVWNKEALRNDKACPK